MTAVLTEQPTEAAALPSASRTVRWRRRALILLAIAVPVVIVLIACWTAAAAGARSGLQVLTDSRSLTCTPAAALTTADSEIGGSDDTTLRIPAIRLDGPIRCTMIVVLRNTSGQPLTVTRVAIDPGPELTRLQTGDDAGLGPVGTPLTLQAHDVDTVQIGLRFSDGCVFSGVTDTYFDTPIATVEALGLSGSVSRPGPSFALLGTRNSEHGCPGHH